MKLGIHPKASFTVLAAILFWAPLLGLGNPSGVSGRIVGIQGRLAVNGKPAFKNQTLVVGSRISTDHKSLARIELSDGSITTVPERSQVVLREFRNESGEDRPEIQLYTGKVRVTVPTAEAPVTRPPTKLRIRTSAGIAGVRGTDFSAIYNQEQNRFAVVSFEGQVSLATPNSSVEHPIQPGQFRAIENGTNVTEAIRISPAQLTALQASSVQPTGEPAASATQETAAAADAQPILPPGMDSIATPAVGDNPMSPKPGGFVDLNTGIYIPPPPGSLYDSQAGVFVPPPSLGTIDLNSGQYKPPPNTTLGADGTLRNVVTGESRQVAGPIPAGSPPLSPPSRQPASTSPSPVLRPITRDPVFDSNPNRDFLRDSQGLQPRPPVTNPITNEMIRVNFNISW